METVWKFGFGIREIVDLEMPKGATILLVECQGDQPCIWARVNPEQPKVVRHFAVTGTGHPTVKPNYKHVGSFQQPPFVWHLWEVE